MKRTVIYSSILASIMLCLALFFWFNGKPYGNPEWSPTRNHYLQRYKTISFQFAAMPGQGSDDLRGYFCLFNKEGKQLKRSVIMDLANAEPKWSNNEVSFFDTDNLVVWKLD